MICAYDYIAIGAMSYIKTHGYNIPDDIAVFGMDNIEEAKYMVPPLASLETLTDKLCAAAVENLMNIINNKDYQKEIMFDSTLYIRESAKIIP